MNDNIDTNNNSNSDKEKVENKINLTSPSVSKRTDATSFLCPDRERSMSIPSTRPSFLFLTSSSGIRKY